MADFELVRIANSTQTAEWWKEHNPVLYAGEIGFEIDTGLKKTGRGEGVHWNDIPYDINILPGKGKFSNQVISDPTSVKNNSFSFKDKNPIAISLRPELNGNIEYGAIGDYSAVFGGKASAQGKRSFAEGTTTIAIGAYSHAEGDNCVTLGDDSHAEGYRNTTQGNSSHVEGANNLTIGVSSHAEGAENVAEGDASHAEGGQTHSEGIYSHAEGVATHAQAKASHTEGENTSAGGQGAHAEGIGTKADGMYQHVQGKFNIVDVNKAHIVGGGESVGNPRNIHTLDWDGNAIYAGDVFANDNKKLATEEWVKSDASGKLDAKGWTNRNGRLAKEGIDENGWTTNQVIGIDETGISLQGWAGTLHYTSYGITGTVDSSYTGPFEVTDNHIVVNDKEFQYPSKSGTLLVDADFDTSNASSTGTNVVIYENGQFKAIQIAIGGTY